jgi:hypothetical protein
LSWIDYKRLLLPYLSKSVLNLCHAIIVLKFASYELATNDKKILIRSHMSFPYLTGFISSIYDSLPFSSVFLVAAPATFHATKKIVRIWIDFTEQAPLPHTRHEEIQREREASTIASWSLIGLGTAYIISPRVRQIIYQPIYSLMHRIQPYVLSIIKNLNKQNLEDLASQAAFRSGYSIGVLLIFGSTVYIAVKMLSQFKTSY